MLHLLLGLLVVIYTLLDEGLGFRFRVSGFRVQGLKFRV